MGWLIAYDITDPRRWRAVYKRVRADAARVQFSLFYGEITTRQVDAMAADVARLIDPSEDDVRFYLLPDDAWVRMRGRPPVPEGIHAGDLARLVARGAKGR